MVFISSTHGGISSSLSQGGGGAGFIVSRWCVCLVGRAHVLIISSRRSLYRVLGFGLRGRNCRISATGSTRRTLGVSVDDCRLVLLSMVVKRVSNFGVTGVLGGSGGATGIPVVFVATGSARGSAIANFGLKTSSCVSGPFSLHRIVTHIGTMLQHATATRARETPRQLICRSLIVSVAGGGIDVSNRRIRLAGGRFRVLLLLMRGGKHMFSHRSVLAHV